MKIKMNRLIGVVIGLVLIAAPLWAQDYRSYSTSELMGMRDTIHRMPQHEQDAFNQEMHQRFRAMTPAERNRYGWHMNDGHMNTPGYHHDQNGFMNDGEWGNGYHRGYRGNGRYSQGMGGGC